MRGPLSTSMGLSTGETHSFLGHEPGSPGSRDAGIAILFLSNKAIYRASHYVSLLSDLGIQVEESEVVNSSLVTARFLSERHRTGRSS